MECSAQPAIINDYGEVVPQYSEYVRIELERCNGRQVGIIIKNACGMAPLAAITRYNNPTRDFRL